MGAMRGFGMAMLAALSAMARGQAMPVTLKTANIDEGFLEYVGTPSESPKGYYALSQPKRRKLARVTARPCKGVRCLARRPWSSRRSGR